MASKSNLFFQFLNIEIVNIDHLTGALFDFRLKRFLLQLLVKEMSTFECNKGFLDIVTYGSMYGLKVVLRI